jgi:hypothetical protein
MYNNFVGSSKRKIAIESLDTIDLNKENNKRIKQIGIKIYNCIM